MRILILELDQALRNHIPVCYTAVVETRGSTPQKAGAAMLVFPDGSQSGTLGGGCVEADVKRRALQLLDAGQPELLTFQLDSDYGWEDGLIGGGRMKLLVDPLRIGSDQQYYHQLARRLEAGQGVTEAVVIESGDAREKPRTNMIEPVVAQPGDRFLFNEQGELIANRAKSSQPPHLHAGLRPLSDRPRPYIVAGVSYLPHLPRCRLIIIGAGRVGQKVAELAADLDFAVWVVDDRAEFCSLERFPASERLIASPFDEALRALPIDANTFCIIVTQEHHHDKEALFHLAERGARYLGLIGSRRKIKLIYRDLLERGISEAALRQVAAPLGLEIGSQSVPEIAVSIVAELVAHRNLGGLPAVVRGPSLMDSL